MLPCGLEAQSSSGPAPQTHFDSQLWVDDFHQLIGAMESHYSELDWAINDRHMDLPKLRQEEKLKESGDEQTARRALEQFLNAFGDGHLSIEWPRSDVPRRTRNREQLNLCAIVLDTNPLQTPASTFRCYPASRLSRQLGASCFREDC